MDDIEVLHGDALEVLRGMDDNSVDAVVTDPPYGLAFMGKRWDYDLPSVELWREVYRVAKPGAHLLAFGGTRTYHRAVCRIEDAGWFPFDQLAWIFGSGFPKSHNISKAIDKRRDWPALTRLQSEIKEARLALGVSQSEAARRCGIIEPDASLGGGGFMWFETGKIPTRDEYQALKRGLDLNGECDAAFEEAEREVIGRSSNGQGVGWAEAGLAGYKSEYDITAPATDAAKQWDGWGTALKPAHEPIVLARKPCEGTIAQNVMTWGVGGLNVDACRVDFANDKDKGDAKTRFKRAWSSDESDDGWQREAHKNYRPTSTGTGRWPANLIHDGSDEVLALFPVTTSGARSGANPNATDSLAKAYAGGWKQTGGACEGSTGSAARFFYCAKASRRERDAGLEGMPERQVFGDNGGTYQGLSNSCRPSRNHHPTVKPVALMEYLCKLITPPNGLILDPFAGSGTTGVAVARLGFRAKLIERDDEYVEIARRRITHAMQNANVQGLLMEALS